MTALTALTGDVPEFPTARECPYRPPAATEQLRERGPVVPVRLVDGSVAWYVGGYAEARALLSDPRISSDRTHPSFPVPVTIPAELREQLRTKEATPLNSAALIGTDPPEHTRQRRMVIPSFAVRRIAALRPAIQRIVDDRVDAMLRQGPTADLMSVFALPIPSAVICRLLGIPYADHEFFEEQARLRLDPIHGADARTALYAYLDDLMRHKLADPGDGLLDDLVAEQLVAGPADVAELVSFAMVLLIAGHDTTANVIALGTLALLDHPEQWARLQADPESVPAAVEELLRYVSLIGALMRVSVADLDIGGQHIRAGDGILIGVAAANHDPGFVERPHDLDVDRPARHHLGFGFGVHQCLGQNLARAELEIAFRTLAARIPTLRPAVPHDRIRSTSGLLAGLVDFPVTW